MKEHLHFIIIIAYPKPAIHIAFCMAQSACRPSNDTVRYFCIDSFIPKNYTGLPLKELPPCALQRLVFLIWAAYGVFPVLSVKIAAAGGMQAKLSA